MNTELRRLGKTWAAIAAFLASLLLLLSLVYALQILPRFGIPIYKEQFLALFLTIALVLTFIMVPARTRKAPPPEGAIEPVPWYDLILALAALLAGGYVSLWYHVLLPQIGVLTQDKIIASTVGIAVLLEATRRYAGWTMTIVGLTALGYSLLGHHLEGLFSNRMIRFDRLMITNYLGDGGIHGIPLAVAATIVISFMLFGQMLFRVGGGDAMSDFAFALMGRNRGGPAKVAVAASAMFGSLSGSASANVATTGMVTIPMMVKTGYRPHQAAAIEAVASTGGLILPPIMAATGFIMAEFLQVPYADVAIAAALPALLFYVCIFIQVDLEAAKRGMTGWGEGAIPQLWPAVKAVGPVVLPLGVLVYALFWEYQSPETSAFLATVATVVMSLIVPRMRRPWREYLAVIVETGKAVVYIAIVCAIAGLVIGCLGITGLGASLSDKLIQLSGGEIWLLLLLTAIGSIILGMGVPVTATYIILIVLVGPALVKAGIDEMAAHMFVFYFGTLSFLTPPVCISVFVAAALAKSDPLKTAWFAVRLAVVAYILPFVFVFDQGLFLRGGIETIANSIIGAVIGVGLLSAGLVGYLGGPMGKLVRGIAVLGGAGTLAFGQSSWLPAGIGLVLLLALLLIPSLTGPPRRPVTPPGG